MHGNDLNLVAKKSNAIYLYKLKLHVSSIALLKLHECMLSGMCTCDMHKARK